MKPMLLTLSSCILFSLSSCLKDYTCECQRTYYKQYKVDSTAKFSAQFNGSRKSPVIQDCNKLEDSTRNSVGTGWITRCDLKETD